MSQYDPQKRQVSIPARDSASNAMHSHDRSRHTAQEIMREQIDRIYDHEQSTANAHESVYERTHSDQTAHDAAQHDAQWRQYHSAWQSYYQQYYERYYLAQLHKHQQRHVLTATTKSATTTPLETQANETMTKEQAMSSLQGEIMSRIRRSSAKMRNSRHFMPIVSAIVVALIVGLLQYNRLIVANVKAYVSPGEINPQNIVLDPTDINVGPEPKLIIPKINVEAPIVYDVGSLADAPVQKALEGGVVHYPIPGADSLPGQAGNNVILGHSSNDVFDNGGYKFVFVQLDKLSAGDTFYINHKGKRYTYRVTDKFIINPDEVSRLIIDTDKPMTTLVTCTPPGTALRRLVVTAEQVNPDPNAAAARPTLGNTGDQEVPLPGNSESLLERLF